jgi:hypothetical protein
LRGEEYEFTRSLQTTEEFQSALPRPYDNGGFGTEQAKISARDWLRELIEIEGLPASAREWRSITAKASTRLASRVSASSLSAELQIA